ncbi:hypothetical protein SteCoe_23155 [Stentor coeruleus]|uniref:Uncharacterized protein n=1 Tax=Stentor coeruleus TaxID=5963 RepID=A0A1R2BKJ5_9CILI|nr:hypothetical protein SteCoe_23155 [Stentor coeruleus]
MENNSKLRLAGSVVSSLAILYYLFEIEQQIENWVSYDDIINVTDCPQVYGLEIWLLTQSGIWCGSICIMLAVFIAPHMFKLMLCFMYLVGPVFFMWTVFALIVQASFVNCCAEEMDKCEDFYPFKNSSNFVVLLVVSLLFSVSVTVLLASVLISALWQQIRNSILRYQIV